MKYKIYSKPAVMLVGLVLTGMVFSEFASGAQPTLIENATLITMSPEDASPFQGYFVFDGTGFITEVGKGKYTGKLDSEFIRIDASGMIIIPGLVSGHSHLWQAAFRGIAADGELRSWLSALHDTYSDYFSKGDFYWFTLHGALDQLAHGITTTLNHTQRRPSLPGYEQEYLEQNEAEIDAGQHFIFAYASNFNVDDDVRKDQAHAFIEKAQSRIGKSPLLAVSLNVDGGRESAEKMLLEMGIARKYGLTMQTHYLEDSQSREREWKRWDMYKSVGLPGPLTSFAHFIQVTDQILQDTAAAGGAMVWNPLSNGRLASGLADIPRYLELGIKVGMGLDGQASTDVSDPFENMRMGLYALRMRDRHARGMQPLDILRLHTVATAKLLRLDGKIGSLSPGKYADFLIVDPKNPFTGPVFDPIATLIFSCSSDNIDKIYVAGELRVDDGVVLYQDMDLVKKQVQKRVDRIVADQMAAREDN